MFKYILFDLDGTLTNSAPGIIRCVRFTLSQFGIEEKEDEALLKFIGPPLTYSFTRFYGFSEEKAMEAIKVFRTRYDPVGVFENDLYPGIEELLKELKARGCVLLVASSKPEYLVYQVLSHFNIKEYFDIISGAPRDEREYTKEDALETALWELIDLLDGRKPDVTAPRENFISSAMRKASDESLDLDEAMDDHGINKKTCAMVGDRHFDIKAAIEYGVAAIGVDYGFAEDGEFEEAGADIIAVDTEQLLSVLLGESTGRVKKKINLKK